MEADKNGDRLREDRQKQRKAWDDPSFTVASRMRQLELESEPEPVDKPRRAKTERSMSDEMRGMINTLTESLSTSECIHLVRRLGLDDSTIDHTKHEHRCAKEQIYRLLRAWKKEFGRDATIDKMYRALIDIGNKELAEKLTGHTDVRGRSRDHRSSPEVKEVVKPSTEPKRAYTERPSPASRDDLSESKIRRIFNRIDTKRNGVISIEELKEGLDRCGMDNDDNEIYKFMRRIDSEDGQVTFQAFYNFLKDKFSEYKKKQEDERHRELFGTGKSFPKAKQLRKQFYELDRDGNGYITINELKVALSETDRHFTDGEVYKLMRQVDDDGDGRISYDEYVIIMAKVHGRK
ncbi:uncharacterized protein LOC144445876 [Glandiceps talaboti]